MAESRPCNFVVQGLQCFLAAVVMGTDGYAIHVFRGSDQQVDDPVYGGKATLHVGVPSAWGFLLFCAVWTILTVVFHVVEPGLASRRAIGYLGVTAEAVAVLSWLAGFIAVAVNVATSTSCSSGKNACAVLKAATVFGALEWLLFLFTASPLIMSFLHRRAEEKRLAAANVGGVDLGSKPESRHKHHHHKKDRASRDTEEASV